MTSRKVWWSGAWVDVGGGDLADQFPAPYTTDGVDAATTTRAAEVTFTSHATEAHSAGAWVQIEASTAADVSALVYQLRTNNQINGNTSATLLEIGVGASGSEVLWATVQVGYSVTAGFSVPWNVIPGAIPAGSRVAGRLRSVQLAKAVNFSFLFRSAPSAQLGAPVTYGADTAASQGLALTAPGSLNSKGAWTELSSSTAVALYAVNVSIGANNSFQFGTQVLVDIGIGSAGNEVVIIPDIYWICVNSEYFWQASEVTFGYQIPAGSRLCARYARGTSTQQVDLILNCAPAA